LNSFIIKKFFKGYDSSPQVLNQFINTISSLAYLTGSLLQLKDAEPAVVDKNFNLHGTNNIFCVDGSIILATDSQNVTLNIVDNSFSLASYLNEKK
jgi:hypothetical protein